MRTQMKASRIITVFALALLAALPAWAQTRGKADFTRYVALGDSYAAGVESNSLVVSHQNLNYVAVLAKQTGAADFQIPTVSQPGIGPELQLLSLVPLQIVPKASTNGVPTNLSLPRPYNNLGIPGARVADLMTLTGKEPPTNTQKAFAQFILRGLGTAAQQAVAQQPTFISVWIGGNDLLGAVLDGSPNSLTPLADFTRDYNALLDFLTAAAPNAGMVLGSLADAEAVPFATTIPPFLINPATNKPVLGPDGKPIYYFADLGGGKLGQLTPGARVTLGAQPFLATGYGIPPALAPLFPTLPNAGKPLPDAVCLTTDELAVISQAEVDFNKVIFAAGAKRNIPVVDLHTFFEHAKAGITYGGITINAAFLTGGMFSYDGFHPSDIGYAIVGNEFIKTINAAYGTNYPETSITRFFQNNGKYAHAAKFDEVMPGTPFEYSQQVWHDLLRMEGSSAPIRVADPTFE